MYEPEEDSYMLQRQVKRIAKGIVLDMGTGSGIQAETAAKSRKVTKVYAVDIDLESVYYCQDVIKDNKITFLHSNLFQAFKGNKRYKGIKFDTIIFNAPYLPYDEDIEDPALYGGKKGYELICKFFNEAERYIKPTTKILLVFSSHTGREKLEKFLLKKKFKFKELEKKHIFFEDIFVYLIEKDETF